MNSSQIHLALTHVPVILSLVGLVILIIAISKRNDVLTKTAFFLLLFAGVFAVPVFFTGEGAEEAVENMPGVSKTVIESHEDFAKVAFSVVSACAFLSLIGLLLYGKISVRKFMRPFILLIALASAGTMIVTAHLGGQVRHTEMRSGFTTSTEGKTNNGMQNSLHDDND